MPGNYPDRRIYDIVSPTLTTSGGQRFGNTKTPEVPKSEVDVDHGSKDPSGSLMTIRSWGREYQRRDHVGAHVSSDGVSRCPSQSGTHWDPKGPLNESYEPKSRSRSESSKPKGQVSSDPALRVKSQLQEKRGCVEQEL
jgi:hypothetical protein